MNPTPLTLTQANEKPTKRRNLARWQYNRLRRLNHSGKLSERQFKRASWLVTQLEKKGEL